MPYTYTPVAGNKSHYATMAAVRAEFKGYTVTKTQVLDGDTVLGKITWVKDMPARPADVANAPTSGTPSDTRSLDDVLADIDALEADDDEEPELEPVRFDTTSDEDIDAIVDWQLRNSPAARTQGGRAPAARVGRRRSHANCTHATSGEAGKKARAACRKARAAAERQAQAS